MADRIPPHSLEAEAGVLGGFLLGTDALVDLAPEEFYRTGHSLVWTAMLALQSEGVPPDTVTVVNWLRKHGNLEKAGGAAYISELTGQVPSTERVEHYARIVREKAAKRTVLNAARKAQEEVFDPTLNASDILANFDQYAAVKESGRGPRNIRAVMKDVFKATEAAMKSGVPLGMEVGLYDLDAFCRAQGGDLVVVAGRPGMGKSALGTGIISHCCQRGAAGLFVTAEMSDTNQVIRLMSSESNVESAAIREGRIKDHDYGILTAAAGRLAETEITFLDKAAPTVQQIRRVAAKLARKKLDLIVIDYLQLMGRPGRMEREEAVSENSKGCKNLAKEFNIPVFLLSQLNREVDKRNPPIPMLSDLRESGSIEQDADIVWMLYRPEAYQGEKTANDEKGIGYLYVRKQRNGPTGQVKLNWDGPRTIYRNMDRRGY